MSLKKIIAANKSAKIGFWGILIAAVCCFTPALVLIFSAVGLSVLVDYIDIVLLPVLAICIALFLFGYFQYRNPRRDGDRGTN